MKSLEPNIYVRTKYGIKQIDEINVYKTKYQWLHKFKYKSEDGTVNLGVLPDKDIIGEPSFDITDLIKEGDYINGLRVEKNKYGELYIGYVYCGGDIGKTAECYVNFIKEMDKEYIYTIVTKEQFKNSCYKIGER